MRDKLSYRIRSLAASVPDEVSEDPALIVRALIFLAEEIYIDKFDSTEYYEWCSQIAGLWCEISSKHDWIHDHCGFWGTNTANVVVV